MEQVKVDIYFDGACRNVKGSTEEYFGVGLVVLIDNQLSEKFSRSDITGVGTSNISEWVGCISALYTAIELKEFCEFLEGTELVLSIYSDSELITKQFNGEYEVRQPHLYKYYKKSCELKEKLGDIKIQWIPREKNTLADEYSKTSLELIRSEHKFNYWFHDPSDSLFIEEKSRTIDVIETMIEREFTTMLGPAVTFTEEELRLLCLEYNESNIETFLEQQKEILKEIKEKCQTQTTM